MLTSTFFGFEVIDLVYFFVIYAFIGWIIESFYASLSEGRFINRGFLNGPFCPIYGFGAVLIIVALHPVLDRPFLLFSGAVIITSTLEYLTGLGLEKVFDQKWWDYSNRRFNVKGRICLLFSLYWGIGAIIIMKLVQPWIVNMVGKIPSQYGFLIVYGLIGYFLIDFVWTLRSVLELRSLLLQMHLLAMEAREAIEYIKESSLEAIEETREELRAKYELLLARASAGPKRLVNAFPELKARHYEHIFQDIKDRWNQR
jgi:uncharacterized membrane protein